MRRIAAVLAAVVVACGDAASARAAPSPTPTVAPSSAASSPYEAAVRPLMDAVSADVFLPDGLPSALIPRAWLYAAQTPGKPRGTLGDPVLAIQFTAVPNGKPVLTLLQGPSGCCGDLKEAQASTVTIRPGVEGELVTGRGVESPRLRWREPAGTELVLVGSSFGQFADEPSLLAVAHTVRPVPRPARGVALVAYWSTHESHSPTGHRVFIAVRQAPTPDAARILDAQGVTVAAAQFAPPPSFSCLASAPAIAALQVPRDVVQQFRPGQPSAYRAELSIAGQWRPVALVAGGCFSIE